MSLEKVVQAQLSKTLKESHFDFAGTLYRGKVRDVYDAGDRLLIVTTDRVSAFDHVLGTIPFKGEILTRIALEAFTDTRDIVPNHVLESPDPNVIVARKCRPYPVEFIVRGYITGSLWRDYEAGSRELYGLSFAEDLKRDQKFPQPVVTPSTKADIGDHDQPTSRAEIVAKGTMTDLEYEEAEKIALLLFHRGQTLARERGLILVDTKYEMGLDQEGKLTLIDEIHTPDSSRYWVSEEYQTRFENGAEQRMLDKENLRSWLISQHGFSGHGTPPKLDDNIRTKLALHYVELFRRLSGKTFTASPAEVLPRVELALREHLADNG